MTETPSMDSGYWKARKRPALARASVAQWVTSSPLEADGAAGDLVGRVAHQGGGQGGLPGAVRSHQGVDLSGGHRQVDPPQDLGAIHGHVETLDLEQGGLGGERHDQKSTSLVTFTRLAIGEIPVGRAWPVRSQPVATPWTLLRARWPPTRWCRGIGDPG